MNPLPVIAIIGRPNVGKSTLFNRLTRTRDALVADMPGLTRDRQYGRGRVGDIPYFIVDTGGFEPDSKSGVSSAMARQTRQAVVESDSVLFIVDGRDGLTPHDRDIAEEIRRHATKVFLIVNKVEGMAVDTVSAEFHELGLGDPIAISSAHGDGVPAMIEYVLRAFIPPPMPVDDSSAEWPDAGHDTGETGEPGSAEGAEDAKPVNAADPAESDRPVRIAVIGRPNAGKSTLINTMLGEERLVAFDQPGTTRDSVEVPFAQNGRDYILIDTAGVRRRGRVSEAIEKFSVIKTLQAIDACNVCILLLDASEGVSEQDAHLAGHIIEAGRALVVAVNKWDAIDAGDRDRFKSEVDRKFHFLSFARFHYISALKARGLGQMLRSANDAYAAAMVKLPTPRLTRAMIEAVSRQEPPRRGGGRPKLRYAHQGGQNPPIVVIHGSALSGLPDSYIRYLEGWFRKEFSLDGTPMRVELRTASNPYVKNDAKGRRNGR
ncbi:MAG: ribosome biogenesis GTPase Der [Burkholderiaceae bacterium]